MSDAPNIRDGFVWWAPLAAFLIAFGVGGIAFAVIAAVVGSEPDSPGVTLGSTALMNAVLAVATVGIAGLGGRRVTPATFGLRRVDPRRVAGLAIVLFLIFYAFLVAWSQLDPGAEDDLATDLGADESTLALIGVILVAALMAPLIEEFFWRGFLFGTLRHLMAWPLAAVISGVCFGAVHVGTPAIFLVPLAVFGGLLCVLYQRTGSLIPGMALHAFNNCLALAVSLEWTFAQGVAAVIIGPVIVVLLASAVAGRDA